MHVDSSWITETGGSQITFLISSLLYAGQLQVSINKAKTLKKSKSKHFDVRVVVEMSSKRCRESPRILKGKLLYWNNPANKQIFSSEVWKNKKLFCSRKQFMDIIEIGKMSKSTLACISVLLSVTISLLLKLRIKWRSAMNKIEWRQLTVYFQIVENELKTTIWTYDQ